MKIIIKSKQSHKRLVLRFPLSFIKTQFAMKMFEEKGKNHIEDKKELKKNLNIVIKQIRTYIRENGHFNLVEVHSSDGENIIIRV